MRTFRDAKIMAKTLRSEVLTRTQADLPHSAALEIVARQFGFDDWNVLAARIAAGSSQIVPASETSGLHLTDRRTRCVAHGGGPRSLRGWPVGCVRSASGSSDGTGSPTSVPRP